MSGKLERWCHRMAAYLECATLTISRARHWATTTSSSYWGTTRRFRPPRTGGNKASLFSTSPVKAPRTGANGSPTERWRRSPISNKREASKELAEETSRSNRQRGRRLCASTTHSSTSRSSTHRHRRGHRAPDGSTFPVDSSAPSLPGAHASASLDLTETISALGRRHSSCGAVDRSRADRMDRRPGALTAGHLSTIRLSARQSRYGRHRDAKNRAA